MVSGLFTPAQGTQSQAHARRVSSTGVHNAAGEPLRADMPPRIDIAAFPLLWQNVTLGPEAISDGRCGPRGGICSKILGGIACLSFLSSM